MYLSDLHPPPGCDGVHCLITSEGPYGNMHSYEHCKLSGLPDLNHSDPNVVHRLVEWMKWTEKEFKPDGIRFDACHNSLEVRVSGSGRGLGYVGAFSVAAAAAPGCDIAVLSRC